MKQKAMNMRKYLGFSLIELMVAMVIGLIILLGLVSLFSSSSALNRAQTGLSILQENGRYAISRIKRDIESAGRQHCATVAMPDSSGNQDWIEGYELNSWLVDANVLFTNGLPNNVNIFMDSPNDGDRLGDTALSSSDDFPMDPSFFIRGHECSDTSCTPDIATIGSDFTANFGAVGTGNGNRPAFSDILTMRTITASSGLLITDINTASSTLTYDPPSATGFNGVGLISDCYRSYVANVNGNSISNTNPIPSFDLQSGARLYNLDADMETVSYYLKLDTDINDSNRLISSLYRSQNGVEQQLVEGVERFDVFYLAQLQSGQVARLTADEVQGVSNGGDNDDNGTIDDAIACIQPPKKVANSFGNLEIANDPGCLWRSIYAIEVHMLLNTVDDSSTVRDDRFVYSPDGTTPQNPTAGLASGLNAGRMYRREFTAIVPIRSYTL